MAKSTNHMAIRVSVMGVIKKGVENHLNFTPPKSWLIWPEMAFTNMFCLEGFESPLIGELS